MDIPLIMRFLTYIVALFMIGTGVGQLIDVFVGSEGNKVIAFFEVFYYT